MTITRQYALIFPPA